MTIGGAKMLETEAILFSMNTEQNDRPDVLSEETANIIKLDKGTNKIDITGRFARLKKSLRKRSVSIL